MNYPLTAVGARARVPNTRRDGFSKRVGLTSIVVLLGAAAAWSASSAAQSSNGRMLELETPTDLGQDVSAMIEAAEQAPASTLTPDQQRRVQRIQATLDGVNQRLEGLRMQLALIDEGSEDGDRGALEDEIEILEQKAGALRRAIARQSELDEPQPPVDEPVEPPAPPPENDLAGCSIDPASPSIGADVPESYFGPAPATVNPSFIGPVQLLTSGPIDTRARTITLPLYRGQMVTGENVWYVATDTTDERNSEALGLNFSAKLAFADTGRGVRTATVAGDGLLVFEQGEVDFAPERELEPGAEPNPFPPSVAEPGSLGDVLYTPLVKILNAGGHVWNMPIIAFDVSEEEINFPNGDPDYTKVHDAVVAIDTVNETVTLALVPGFSFGRPVLYLSLDSSDRATAAVEGITFAPGLQDIELGSDDSLFSAIERLFTFSNGPTGCENPQRQGLGAAVTDGSSPFNVLGGIPTLATDYSPLWDVNLGEWTQEAIDAGFRSRLTDEFQILGFVLNDFVTGPGGSDYGSVGVIVNCPIVFRFL